MVKAAAKPSCPVCRSKAIIACEEEIIGCVRQFRKIEGIHVRAQRSGGYTVFSLLQCPQCQTFYMDGRHQWEDPESDMGMNRDRGVYRSLTRLKPREAVNLIKGLIEKNQADCVRLQDELITARALVRAVEKGIKGAGRATEE